MKIPKDNPRISVSNWPTFQKQGWRWVRNIATPKGADEWNSNAVIASYQRSHGVDNVTVGNAWQAIFGPAGMDGALGIYVNDIEKQVEQLYEEIAEFEKLVCAECDGESDGDCPICDREED